MILQRHVPFWSFQTSSGLMIAVLLLIGNARQSLAQTPSSGSQPAQSATQTQSAFLSKNVSLTCHKQSFAEITSLLSQQMGHSIIADGEPIRKQADLQLRSTAETALNQLADLFDYTWTVNKHGIVVMRKRFQVVGEMPQMRLAEMRQVAQEMLNVLTAQEYETGARQDEWMTRFYAALTPEQRQRLSTPQGLLGTQLTETQSDIFRRYVLNSCFGDTLALWEKTSAQLNNAPQTTFVLREWPRWWQVKNHLPIGPDPNAPACLSLDWELQDRAGKQWGGILLQMPLPLDKMQALIRDGEKSRAKNAKTGGQ